MCDGPYEIEEDCANAINTCEYQGDTTYALDTNSLTSTDYYMHWGCCTVAGSTAIRIRGYNAQGNSLGINGVYELVYETYPSDADIQAGTNPTHKYQRLRHILTDSTDPTLTVTIEQLNGNGKWQVIVAGDSANPYLESELVSSCPTTAGKWIMKDPTKATTLKDTVTTTDIHQTTSLQLDDTVPIIVTCSEGNSKCPATHPYSYHHGNRCCSSPFNFPSTNSPSDPSTLLNPGDEYDANNVASDPCLGESVDCASQTVTNPCRRNLENPANFKALAGGVHQYDKIIMCENKCFSVDFTSLAKT